MHLRCQSSATYVLPQLVPRPIVFTFGLWGASFPDYSAWLCLGSGPPVHKIRDKICRTWPPYTSMEYYAPYGNMPRSTEYCAELLLS
ncbi:unnamed protein product [Penicillium roqueforti FM164]|uniref:Genomic scaffold, ProqFM164S03 n=1 Tax=Penicillium roqueforti (strain FM164) TaxID=1365484 RepID=W6QWZ9_PENRF|nr:unnamed protein product [Penicillium roqueforti FM164]